MAQPTKGTGRSSVTRRNVLKTSTVAAGLAGLAGCTGGGDGGTETTAEQTTQRTTTTISGDKDPIRLGYSMPLTGQWGFLGQAVEPSVRMVANRVNEQGGIDGHPIKVTIEDTKGKPSAGLTAARQQLNANNVDLLIGWSSFSVMQVVDIIMEAGIPWTVACSGTTELIPKHSSCGPYRTIPNDSIQGWASAIGARFKKFNGVQDFTDFAVITCKTADCKSLASTHAQAYEQIGGNHLGTVEIASGQSSYDTPVRKVRDLDPDIVYVMAGPPEVKKILRTGVQIGFNPYWNLPSDYSTPKFLKEAPEQVQDHYFTYLETAPEGVNEEVKKMYASEYREVAGFEPGPCWRSAVDGMNMLLTATKAASVDGGISQENICSKMRQVATPGGEPAYTYEEAAGFLDDGKEVDLYGIISDLNFTDNNEVNVPFNMLVPNDAGTDFEVVGTIGPKDIADAKKGNL